MMPMPSDEPFENRRERPVAIDWNDCEWQPRITVGPVAVVGPVSRRPAEDCSRRHLIFNAMKTKLSSRHHPSSATASLRKTGRGGFTLIELLVVIAIIAILAA